MKMTSPAELQNRKMIRITGTGPESRSRLFSQAPQLRRVCDCLGRSQMREGPEWRRRATGGRLEVRGSTRGGPEMNRKTGNGPEVRGTTEVDQKWTGRKIE
ncbi:hypothetical protein B0H10DRAFT_2198095 [Mycena sp. CBHHK59/15]|nr:hypothetical protein B0H10DRAFT_2198095 [Mycena sp. CBHHK59/15]